MRFDGTAHVGYCLTSGADYELIGVFSVLPTNFAAVTNFVNMVSPLSCISGTAFACTQIATAAEFVPKFH